MATARAPRCHRCGEIRVLSPCRDCATPAEAKGYPALPEIDLTREPARS